MITFLFGFFAAAGILTAELGLCLALLLLLGRSR